MIKHTLLLLCITLYTVTAIHAQGTGVPLSDTLSGNKPEVPSQTTPSPRILISGYVQAQFTYAEKSFSPGNDKRFQVRRGRIKFSFVSPKNTKGWSTSQYVLQVDITERGLNIKDAYTILTDPWTGWFNIQAGMFNRPFGFENPYSSGVRESPERGRMSGIIFPNVKDLGASLAIQGPKTSAFHWLRIEGGWFNGVGGPSSLAEADEFDKKKDFIGRISTTRKLSSGKVTVSGGFSMYEGGFRIDSVNVFTMNTDNRGVKGYSLVSHAADNYKDGLTGSRSYTKRRYMGADAQVSFDWAGGRTILRGEYIQGTQPSTSVSSSSPSSAVTKDIYYRKFNGAYFYFIQNIRTSPWQVLLKYDWYDPNTAVKGNQVGDAVVPGFVATNSTDLCYRTLGFGAIWLWDSHAKIIAYYDRIINETTDQPGSVSYYSKDVPDDLITLRIQAEF
ncbi:MAG: hypothetical protein IT242_01210 [Bacteroidia bacterium]|nr:hypothetical protein [Bacteroidia bacterium]